MKKTGLVGFKAADGMGKALAQLWLGPWLCHVMADGNGTGSHIENWVGPPGSDGNSCLPRANMG